jgi:hypothetical protein
MRGFLFYKAASADFRVKVLVVPVAGHNPVRPCGPVTVLPMPGPGELAAHAFDLARERYALDAVIPRIGRFFQSAAADRAVPARA